MKKDLEQHLEESFDFTSFERLTATGDAITSRTGELCYVPTDIPIPFDKRVLSAITDSNDVRVLPMPVDEWEFEKTVYSGIEYLLNQNGDATVAFFCPRSLADTYQDLPGSDFVRMKRVQLEDPTRTIREAFERAAMKRGVRCGRRYRRPQSPIVSWAPRRPGRHRPASQSAVGSSTTKTDPSGSLSSTHTSPP